MQLTVATVVDKLFYQFDETDITLVIMMIESQLEKTQFVALLSGIFKYYKKGLKYSYAVVSLTGQTLIPTGWRCFCVELG